MGSRLSAPGPQEKRFAAYIEGLANAAGHEDRHAPLMNYCKGLLLPGERKSIEPMAGRLDANNVQPVRQSLHHLVAKAPWSDETLLDEVRHQVLPAMQKLRARRIAGLEFQIDHQGRAGFENRFSLPHIQPANRPEVRCLAKPDEHLALR